MQTFSEELNKLIAQKRIVVKDLIDFLNYDRSTFFKIKKGQRLPATEDMVKSIADFMRLTPTEYEKLLEAYHIDKEGPYNYYGRKEIESFIVNLQKGSVLSDPLVHPLDFGGRDIAPVSGKFNVNQMIGDIICQKEAQSVLICEMQTDVFTMQFVDKALSMGKSVKHILRIDSSRDVDVDNRLYNIDTLNLISSAQLSGADYQAYCYYSSNVNEDITGTYMPCIIVAGEYVMQYSVDRMAGVAFHNDAIRRMYEHLTEDYLSKSGPFGKVLHGGDFYKSIREAAEQSGKQPVYILSPGYCMSLMLKEDEQLTQKHLLQNIPHRDELIAQWHLHWKLLQEILYGNENIRFMSVRSALQYTERTGYINEVPARIVEPLSEKEIRDLKVQWHLVTQNYHYKDVDIPALDETSAVSVVSSPKLAVITATDNVRITVHQFVLSELSITQLIYNWLQKLYSK